MADTDSTDASLKDAIKDGIKAIGGNSGKKTVVDGKSPLLAYNMHHKERGVCILINQKRFDPRTGQNTRDGTDVDAETAEATFKKLGFEVKCYTDLRAQDMLTVVLEASKLDHSQNDCFALVIFSHGMEGRIFGTDSTVPIENLTRPFRGDRCPSLVGKPKLFFFQACRGSKFDPGVEMTDSLRYGAAGDIISSKLPTEADFLLAYSVVPGYYSWRNNQDGSWFIQSLCKVLRQHAPEGVELMHMLILVNRMVATSFESCTDAEWTDGMKQMPSVECRLTRLVYFSPKSG